MHQRRWWRGVMILVLTACTAAPPADPTSRSRSWPSSGRLSEVGASPAIIIVDTGTPPMEDGDTGAPRGDPDVPPPVPMTTQAAYFNAWGHEGRQHTLGLFQVADRAASRDALVAIQTRHQDLPRRSVPVIGDALLAWDDGPTVILAWARCTIVVYAVVQWEPDSPEFATFLDYSHQLDRNIQSAQCGLSGHHPQDQPTL